MVGMVFDMTIMNYINFTTKVIDEYYRFFIVCLP